MNHFIVGKDQHIFLAVRIHHGESHAAVIEFPEERIQLHIFQEVVHPAHVPLKGKSKAVVLRSPGHLRPGCGFLGDHHRAVIPSQQAGIQVLEELDRFQVLVVAILVGHPLSVILSVVQIQHGSHRIYTKAVHMALFHPEQGVGQKEILDLRSAIVVDLGTPVGMLALPGIFMLVAGSSVKIGQTMSILGEVSRHPVQDHADLVLVHIVHKIFEIFRSPVTGGRCIVPGHLIAPGSVEWMLRDTHQFDMSVAHIFHILCQTFRRLPVGIKAFLIFFRPGMFHPGTKMHFINGHCILFLVELYAVSHPCGILPYIIVEVRDAGSGSRSFFRPVGIGIRLIKLFTVHTDNKKLIQLAYGCTGNKSLPHTDGACFFHGGDTGVPTVEFSDHGDSLGIRSPHGKINTGRSILFCRMCAKLFVNIIVCSLPKQILVKLGKFHFLFLLVCDPARFRFFPGLCRVTFHPIVTVSSVFRPGTPVTLLHRLFQP